MKNLLRRWIRKTIGVLNRLEYRLGPKPEYVPFEKDWLKEHDTRMEVP